MDKHAKLRALLQYHTKIVESLTTTLNLLDDERRARVNGSGGHGSAMQEAMALDMARRERLADARAAGLHQGWGGKRGRKRGRKPGPKSGTKHAASNGNKQPWPNAKQRKEQRQRSAEYLATFDTSTPRPTSRNDAGFVRAIGSYVRRGYLKKKADGYVRTAKAFEP
jgi:hypothetical protein